MKANIGISEENSKAVALILNQLISDEQVLFAKTRNYHWNIESPSFMELHKFYEKQYTELAETIDEIAERVRKIGHYAEGRLKDYLKLTNLDEGEYTNDQQTQLKNLLDDHETIIRSVRGHISKVEDDYKDIGTADFLTGLLKEHEEWAWMIRAYLK
ncbi:starvation-inducible DNA-binding protein [Chitinophaga sp. CF118]|uniref:Dps family protein n=1 Tax=Chitinophaga sp. CF118 TaxID=1884367 RepID=UPI0008E51F94|nr:DNA starvation/stationary phase protection protein [Chitinophaga sp. CF118]SFD23001.1 starvation-inducible DNA-binding protein [Chitinophaga sp. CF118]